MSHPYDVLDLPNRPGRLLFTPCPGTRETSLAAALDDLIGAGARVLVTLMPVAELEANGAASLPTLCAERGLAWYHLPVSDEDVPREDFDAAWAQARGPICEALDANQTVAIHCKGGSGRTGLIAARLLIEQGLPREAAVALVQSLRPKAIQHPAHVGWLAQFGN